MMKPFGETLRRLRMEKGLSQQQLADTLHVERSSFANWEAGRRLPDAAMISQIAKALDVDAAILLSTAENSDETPNVLLVDDESIILDGGLPVLREALPGAKVFGFTKPSQALDFVRNYPAALVFLDIELGRVSGLDLCRELIRIRPRVNVVYLTSFREYSFDAWDTGACGFLLKPLETEAVRRQLLHLRYPVGGLL
ncbi:MAG: response regulator [Lachnospiraceae bacterium]|nr:response regulator [Lachnospiraceae bacterium]